MVLLGSGSVHFPHVDIIVKSRIGVQVAEFLMIGGQMSLRGKFADLPCVCARKTDANENRI